LQLELVPLEFKQTAVAQVVERGYVVIELEGWLDG
jgi:hypothetical protein